jgi:hypothetical protein
VEYGITPHAVKAADDVGGHIVSAMPHAQPGSRRIGEKVEAVKGGTTIPLWRAIESGVSPSLLPSGFDGCWIVGFDCTRPLHGANLLSAEMKLRVPSLLSWQRSVRPLKRSLSPTKKGLPCPEDLDVKSRTDYTILAPASPKHKWLLARRSCTRRSAKADDRVLTVPLVRLSLLYGPYYIRFDEFVKG